MTPHKCPVCDGTGLVSRPPGVAGDVNQWADNQAGPYDCSPCGGAGVLWASPEPVSIPTVWTDHDDRGAVFSVHEGTACPSTVANASGITDGIGNVSHWRAS